MEILILHNGYRQFGGEDVVVQNEASLLHNAGHRVTVEVVNNRSINSAVQNVRAALYAGYDPGRRDWMGNVLNRVQPDLVHVHNFFPLLTPAVHAEAKKRGLPTVQTLHNYRLLCAAATFEREGEVCELCLHGSRLHAVRNRCYRKSTIGSAAVVRMQQLAVDQGLLTANVDRFIALTEFARSKYIEGGVPAHKLAVKPNFLDRPEFTVAEVRMGALFVGRLSGEKGVSHLIRAWRNLPDIPLTVAGDGPLAAELAADAPGNVRFLGHIDAERVGHEMRKAAVLIVPSIWYEGFPMTLVEAFANGLPALVSGIGSLAEIVRPGLTGGHFNPGDEGALVAMVARAFADPQSLLRMGLEARRVFEQEFSAERNLSQLESIYAEATFASDALTRQ